MTGYIKEFEIEAPFGAYHIGLKGYREVSPDSSADSDWDYNGYAEIEYDIIYHHSANDGCYVVYSTRDDRLDDYVIQKAREIFNV